MTARILKRTVSALIELRVRRLVCQATAFAQRTFREQVPELALRCARRALRLTTMVGHLAGRAGAAVLSGLGVAVSRSTVLRVLMVLPIPDDVAPRKRYARAATAEQLRRPPRYGRSLVDPPAASPCAAGWPPNPACR